MPRPIEVHAPDPQRYVGDMLGWLHQAMAGEKELVGALLGEPAVRALPAPPTSAAEDGSVGEGGGDGGEGAENGDGEEEEDELADPSQVLDRILDGVCRPFKVGLYKLSTS
jgi:hypothetical protein